jgi:hypothetical protein
MRLETVVEQIRHECEKRKYDSLPREEDLQQAAKLKKLTELAR